ncbi:MAG: hypothetical protein M3444_17465 [Acidobacteriota bacterium]|nr:hypothetical protein [Acidobacteriota bacterium]MDQ5835585.1 hypothetical protein [Acidobacteriota bacterium]
MSDESGQQGLARQTAAKEKPGAPERSLGDIVRDQEKKLPTPEKSLSEIVREQIGPLEKAKIADLRSITFIRAGFTLVLLIIFSWLNYSVMSLVRALFEKTGTLDKEVVMTLIAGTVTEVAAVMYIMAQFLFPKGRE